LQANDVFRVTEDGGNTQQRLLFSPDRRRMGSVKRHAFVTVTDYQFFPGTLATVNSVLEFQPEADVYVINNQKAALTTPQVKCLEGNRRVSLLSSSHFERPGRHIGAFELKAYAASDLAPGYDVLVGIDSDCILCSNVDEEIQRCFDTGGFLGGKDGDGVDYDEAYRAYGFSPPARNQKYMSTSLFFCAVNNRNCRMLRRWAECCSLAVFNGRGPYSGHVDQGVLNAVLFAENQANLVGLLENVLWSQHWTYWESVIDFKKGSFVNRSYKNQRQRAFHCGGHEKYWTEEHAARVFQGHFGQTYPYVWFLAMLWFGACQNWAVDPLAYLPPFSHHLVGDLVHFLSPIMEVYPAARSTWNGMADLMINRILSGIPHALSLGRGSLSEIIGLVASHDSIRRYVEIGGYGGGVILALGLRFASRDIDFYSVESFVDHLDALPARRRDIENLARFHKLRVNLIQGDSAPAASLFQNGSIDFLFINSLRETEAVLKDIDTWLPKLSPSGIVAGDAYGSQSVRAAVAQRFPTVNVTASGTVWWTRRRP
jgi:hypothetical protein